MRLKYIILIIHITSCMSVWAEYMVDSELSKPTIQSPEIYPGIDPKNSIAEPTINPSGCYHTQEGKNIFSPISILYWMASTDGTIVNQFPWNGGLVTYTPSGIGREVFLPTEYKPGFKIGLGYNSNLDDWTTLLEYTWLHQTTSHTHFANGSGANLSDGNVFIITASGAIGNGIVGDILNQRWNLKVDLGDLSLSRTYYTGKRLIVEPFAGLRAASIRHTFTTNLDTSSDTAPWVSTIDQSLSTIQCHSWGVGARAGAHSKWLLGAGFRMDAEASASLLFTRYTKISFNIIESTGRVENNHIFSQYENAYNTARANTEVGLGLGWGSYFGARNQYWIDVLASYDFSMWFSQNLARSLADTISRQIGNYGTDLMLQGLTLTAQVDF